MSSKRYVVELSEAERTELMDVVKAKRMSAQKRSRAQILLMVDEGKHGPRWTDEQAAAAYRSRVNTVAALRRHLVEQGFRATIDRKAQAQPSRARKLDEVGERELLAIAQSEPPTGRARWTLHMLAGRLVQLNVVEGSICHETVRAALKKTRSSHTSKSPG